MRKAIQALVVLTGVIGLAGMAPADGVSPDQAIQAAAKAVGWDKVRDRVVEAREGEVGGTPIWLVRFSPANPEIADGRETVQVDRVTGAVLKRESCC